MHNLFKKEIEMKFVSLSLKLFFYILSIYLLTLFVSHWIKGRMMAEKIWRPIPNIFCASLLFFF